MPLDWQLATALVLIFLAAVVRGLTGFGFSLLAITSLALLMPPAHVIPSILMLELAASVHILAEVWKDVHWRSLLPLLLGSLVATPLGVWLLANVPTPPMQVAIGIFTLTAVALMARGLTLKTMPGRFATATIGALSGLANGAFGIGGPPVIVLYFSTPAGHAVGRASLAAYFLAIDVIGLMFLWRQGLVTVQSSWRALIYLPALLAGVWVGSLAFARVNQQQFRNVILAVLAILGLLSIIRGAGFI
jgi:uncharacterized protein